MSSRTFRVLEAATSGSAGKFRPVWRVVRSDGRTYCETWSRDRAEEIARALQAQAGSLTRTVSRPYHYILVRTDLSPGQQMAQAVHAGYEAGCRFGQPDWNGNLVVCACPDEPRLLNAYDRLVQAGVPCVLWAEGDLKNQATSIGTAPLDDSQRQHLKRYPLWRP